MSDLDPAEVIYEVIRHGVYVKVSAVDPKSLVEVSIVGPASAGLATLQTNALQKLRYVLKRRQESQKDR